MFKLKKGNVFQKLNNMDRKQAYTYGGIIVAVFVVLLLLASFLSREEDQSFDGFTTRGYDLADSPFVTDEAEQYLLSSMYPDMQENGASALYSQEEKEARQEEDAKNAEEEYRPEEPRDSEESDSDSKEDRRSSRSNSGRPHYGNRGGGGGGGTKTAINSLGQASMSHAGGGGISNTWGPSRVDTAPFKQNKMEKDRIENQTLNKNDARRALSQFATGSRAAAGLKNNRDMNMKRASMGGDISGAGAFKEDGTVDLSKIDASLLDTNAPQGGTPDLNTIKDAAEKAAEKDKPEDKDELSFWEKVAEKAMQMGMELVQHLATNYLDNAFSNWQETNQFNSNNKAALNSVVNKDPLNWTADDMDILRNAGYEESIISKYHSSGTNAGDFKKDFNLSGEQGKYKSGNHKTYEQYCRGQRDTKSVEYTNRTNTKEQEYTLDGEVYILKNGVLTKKE